MFQAAGKMGPNWFSGAHFCREWWFRGIGDTIKKDMGVSKNRGTPKWMIYNGKPENPIKMDDFGVPLF